MEDFCFPFPGRDLAAQELTYDPCYSKIPPEDREKIVEQAWQKGCQAAEMVFQRESGMGDFAKIAGSSGLKLEEKPVDYVVGKQRYFSDYVSGQNTIHLYAGSIEKWAQKNHLSYDCAVNLILCHEYYHYLEINEIGLTSRDYCVPLVQLGRFRLGKTGIRALSEVGAHGFVGRYFELLREKEPQHETANL